MSTPHKYWKSELNICDPCTRNDHPGCLRIPGEVECQCPECYNDRTDRLDHYLADAEKKIQGADDVQPVKPATAKKMKLKRKLHPRLRVPIGRAGAGGPIDSSGKGV